MQWESVRRQTFRQSFSTVSDKRSLPSVIYNITTSFWRLHCLRNYWQAGTPISQIMATLSLNWSLSHIVRLFIRKVCTWFSATLGRQRIDVDLKRPGNKSDCNHRLGRQTWFSKCQGGVVWNALPNERSLSSYRTIELRARIRSRFFFVSLFKFVRYRVDIWAEILCGRGSVLATATVSFDCDNDQSEL